MLKVVLLLALISSMNCQFVQDLIKYIEQYPEDYPQDIETPEYNFDITTPPQCEECTCSANLCCPYQPLFLPALVCIRQCIRIYPIQFCVCSCLNVFDCCI